MRLLVQAALSPDVRLALIAAQPLARNCSEQRVVVGALRGILLALAPFTSLSEPADNAMATLLDDAVRCADEVADLVFLHAPNRAVSASTHSPFEAAVEALAGWFRPEGGPRAIAVAATRVSLLAQRSVRVADAGMSWDGRGPTQLERLLAIQIN